MKKLRNTWPVFKRTALILLPAVFVLQYLITSFIFIDTAAINGYTAEDSGWLSGYVFHIKACRNPNLNHVQIKYLDVINGLAADIDSNHINHSSWMESAANSLYKLGQNSAMMYYQIDYTDPIETYRDITEEIESGAPEIVTFRGHGEGNQFYSFMYLYDLTANSTSNAQITSTDVRNCDFSSTEIILYIGCKTAKACSNTDFCANLPKDSVDYAGCQIAVGFTEEIACGSANKMARLFYYHYYNTMKDISGYTTMSTSQQLAARISCYITAIREAAKESQLLSSCVYYYNGTFHTCE